MNKFSALRVNTTYIKQNAEDEATIYIAAWCFPIGYEDQSVYDLNSVVEYIKRSPSVLLALSVYPTVQNLPLFIPSTYLLNLIKWLYLIWHSPSANSWTVYKQLDFYFFFVTEILIQFHVYSNQLHTEFLIFPTIQYTLLSIYDLCLPKQLNHTTVHKLTHIFYSPSTYIQR